MKFVVLVFVTLCAFYSIAGQHCRYVTVPVCDGDNNGDASSSSRDTLVTKGAKGDRGNPGKAGAKGSKGDSGEKGEVGGKGMKGSTAQVKELQTHLSNRIDGEKTSRLID